MGINSRKLLFQRPSMLLTTSVPVTSIPDRSLQIPRRYGGSNFPVNLHPQLCLHYIRNPKLTKSSEMCISITKAVWSFPAQALAAKDFSLGLNVFLPDGKTKQWYALTNKMPAEAGCWKAVKKTITSFSRVWEKRALQSFRNSARSGSQRKSQKPRGTTNVNEMPIRGPFHSQCTSSRKRTQD